MQTIRPATAADLPAILDMAEEFTQYFSNIDSSTPDLDRGRLAQTLAKLCFCDRPHVQALIAYDGETPAGYALYNFSFWSDTLDAVVFLPALFIRPTARGQGWGARFMTRLEEIGRAAGCGRIMWNVWQENRAAIAFYRRLGAGIIADEPLMFREIAPL